MPANQLDPDILERWERIDGEIYDMSPPPTSEHQSIVTRLTSEIGIYLKGKTCKVFVAPFGVWLDDSDGGDYVEPDITVICDPSKILHKGCVGAPDMVIEVLSPSTVKKDKSVKLRSYRKAGVRECWIVDPLNQFVEVYLLSDEDTVFPTVYNKDDTVTVSVLEGLDINLRDIFDELHV